MTADDGRSPDATADPTGLSAVAAAAAIRRGDLTSEALTAACLDRVAARDGRIHAWAHVDPAAALAQARACDARPPRGPLHGVPVGVKDLIDTVDLPTAYGSPVYDGHRPATDATCVARLRDAGAVILGKTVTTEFALFHPGLTVNPRDVRRTPGGSSSGSAAAVADRMVPLALGTQTAGSIVRPASFCGVFGHKPTFGAVSTAGVKAISPTLDTVGPLARSVDDLALCAAIMADDPVPGTVDGTATPRVAFARTPEWDRLDPSTRATLDAAADRLGLDRVALPDDHAGLVAAQESLMAAEAAWWLGRERRTSRDLLSDELVTLLDRGAAVGAPAVGAAHALARRCRARLPDVLADHDALLVPAALGEAPQGLAATGDPLPCRAWTLLGVPCVAVPGLRGPDGLPLGVQVVAPVGRDADALAAAAWLAERLDPVVADDPVVRP